MTNINKHVIAALGPTAAGKTRLGVALSKAFQGEVISVDSLQCYEPGAIVTAQPSPAEMEGITHHLIGYLSANEEPHLDFTERAMHKIEDISRRARTPILVGGSMSLTIPVLRKVIGSRYQLLVIALIPRELDHRLAIEARAGEMVEGGLLEELSELWRLEQVHLGGEADFRRGIWKTIGYKELRPYLQSAQADPDRERILGLGIASLKENTLKYGLEQLEWIRQSLMPFLHREGVPTITLPIPSGKRSWRSDVEMPAIRMVGELYHNSSLTTIYSAQCPKRRIICIFGGSSPGFDLVHLEGARSLATMFHRHNVHIVYGGGTTGVMGAVASSLVELSGPEAVHGIIPVALLKHERKLTGRNLDDNFCPRFGMRTVVRDMHCRKRIMVESVQKGGPGSGFVALSGGYGTMEELLEVTTWYQLGIHDLPICVFNVHGFYDGLMKWLSQVAYDGFIGKEDAGILGVASTAEEVIECMGRTGRYSRKGELEWS